MGLQGYVGDASDARKIRVLESKRAADKEALEKAKNDAKVARKGLHLLKDVLVTMGTDEVRTAEDAMTNEIIAVMQALKNENRAGLYI